MKVQEIVRNVLGSGWVAGPLGSKCYRDTSYTKTQRKIRFAFKYLRVKGVASNLNSVKNQRVANQIREELAKNGHDVKEVLVFTDEILIYQNFPIQIVDVA